ncbi:coxsackievirus and adenovirus receptor-like isoform X2 [Perca flavescens]|nr:coxsackievirus and adenovirus receptor-like isoform X2 [Perca flavescens]
MLEWSRVELKPDGEIFRFVHNQSTTDSQHPSYRGRVTLSDPEMKDGDVSVVLKNVRVSDTGTYQCRVGMRGVEEPKVYSSIQLNISVSEEIVVHLGEKATLPCEAANSNIRAVEWSRPDLKPDIVLLYNYTSLDPVHQHPSFKDRVELVDRDLKDGDVSLILKNVNIDDAGTYECRVTSVGSRRKKRAIMDSEPIRIIRLQVTEPAGSHGYGGLVAGALLFVAVAVAAVVGVRMYKRRRDNRPGPPDAAETGDTSTPLTTHRAAQ